MKFIKRILSAAAALFAATPLPPSSSAKAYNMAQAADETSDLLKRNLAGVGRRRDDISARILSRTNNQRKKRNLMRWARANGSLA